MAAGEVRCGLVNNIAACGDTVIFLHRLRSGLLRTPNLILSKLGVLLALEFIQVVQQACDNKTTLLPHGKSAIP